MFNISPLEIVVLLVIALVVLGPQRLPEMARSVGKGMREFRSRADVGRPTTTRTIWTGS